MRTNELSKSPRSSTRERLLEKARELMLAKGFASTSVEDICRAAGITKGGFFHYFDSKIKLAEALLDHWMQAMEREAERANYLKEADPLKRVYGYIDFRIKILASEAFQKGCLLGAFSQELSDTFPEIREICLKHLEQWAGSMERDLEQAKAEYMPGKNFNSYSLAEHFIAILEGSLMLAKVKKDPSIVKTNLLHFKQYLKNLFEERNLNE